MFAKTTFELDGAAPGASIDGTARFLSAYAHARGRPWTTAERQVAWAAGLSIAALDAKQSILEEEHRGEGFAELVRSEAPERLRRAGAGHIWLAIGCLRLTARRSGEQTADGSLLIDTAERLGKQRRHR